VAATEDEHGGNTENSPLPPDEVEAVLNDLPRMT
jgi:hypothetical protein